MWGGIVLELYLQNILKVKVDGIEVEEEQYATAVEVDGIRRTLDSFMKKQDASNDAMKKGLEDVLATITKLGISQAQDKSSSYKGKKPQTTRHFYSPPHSTQVQFHLPEEINWNDHDNIFVEYDSDECPWNAEELDKFYKFAAVHSKGPMLPPLVHQEQEQFNHKVPHHVPATMLLPNA